MVVGYSNQHTTEIRQQGQIYIAAAVGEIARHKNLAVDVAQCLAIAAKVAAEIPDSDLAPFMDGRAPDTETAIMNSVDRRLDLSAVRLTVRETMHRENLPPASDAALDFMAGNILEAMDKAHPVLCGYRRWAPMTMIETFDAPRRSQTQPTTAGALRAAFVAIEGDRA